MFLQFILRGMWMCVIGDTVPRALMLARLKTPFLESESKILYWSPGGKLGYNNIIYNKRYWMLSFKSSNVISSRGLAASSATFLSSKTLRSSNTILITSEVFLGWLHDWLPLGHWRFKHDVDVEQPISAQTHQCTGMLRYRFELKYRLQWHVKV